MRQAQLRDSLAGMSKSCSAWGRPPVCRLTGPPARSPWGRRPPAPAGEDACTAGCREAYPPDWLFERLVEGEPHVPAQGLVRLVRHLHRELDGVAFAQEAWRVGLDHEVFGGDGMILQEPAAHRLVMGEAQEPPPRQRLGHREGHPHHAIGIRGQLWEEERRLVQVLAGGHLAQVGLRRGGLPAGTATALRTRDLSRSGTFP